MEGKWPDLFWPCLLTRHSRVRKYLSFFSFSTFLPARSNRSRYFCHSRKLMLLIFVKNEDCARESGWCFSTCFSYRYLWSKWEEGCWKNNCQFVCENDETYRSRIARTHFEKFENRSFTIRIESKLLEFTLKYKLCCSVIACEKLNYPWNTGWTRINRVKGYYCPATAGGFDAMLNNEISKGKRVRFDPSTAAVGGEAKNFNLRSEGW